MNSAVAIAPCSATPAMIALGSNMGNPEQQVLRAFEALKTLGEAAKISHLYRTRPMYVCEQPEFVNAVAVVHVRFGPRELLARLKGTECELGRSPRIQDGPREIDLDIVAFGRLKYRYFERGAEHLAIPHPKAFERRFVLQPASDIAPDWLLPGLGTVAELLKRTVDPTDSVVEI